MQRVAAGLIVMLIAIATLAVAQSSRAQTISDEPQPIVEPTMGPMHMIPPELADTRFLIL